MNFFTQSGQSSYSVWLTFSPNLPRYLFTYLWVMGKKESWSSCSGLNIYLFFTNLCLFNLSKTNTEWMNISCRNIQFIYNNNQTVIKHIHVYVYSTYNLYLKQLPLSRVECWSSVEDYLRKASFDFLIKIYYWFS